jgi:hypothetical protein
MNVEKKPRRAWTALRRLLVLTAVTSMTACSWMQSHSRGGVAWREACSAHPGAGCPCHVDNDCDTFWCVSGECMHRTP